MHRRVVSAASVVSSIARRTLSELERTSEPRLVTAVEHPTRKGIYTIVMSNPPVNILTPDVLGQLVATLNLLSLSSSSSVDSDGRVEWPSAIKGDSKVQIHPMLQRNPPKGVVLSSSLTDCFSAGLDLDIIASDPPTTPEAFGFYWGRFQDAWRCLQNCPLPVVAAIEGNAPAGGCILATCCDARVMARKSLRTGKAFTIGLTATRGGFAAPHWALADFARVVGRRHAERLAGLGILCTADEALSVGLVDDVIDTCESDAVLNRAWDVAEEYAYTGTPWSRWMAKELFRAEAQRLLPDDPEGRARDTMLFYSSITSDEARKVLLKYRRQVGSGKTKGKPSQ